MAETKGQAFAADAREAGWTVRIISRATDLEIVVSSRGDGESHEEIRQAWQGNRWVYSEEFPVYTIQGRQKKIRNAAAARRILVGGDAASRTPTKKVPRKADSLPKIDFEAAARGMVPKPSKRLPFKVSSPDRMILKAVVGKDITWWNSRARRIETATVMSAPNQRQLRIERTQAQRRVLTFAAAGEGFRSIYIDAILEVS